MRIRNLVWLFGAVIVSVPVGCTLDRTGVSEDDFGAGGHSVAGSGGMAGTGGTNAGGSSQGGTGGTAGHGATGGVGGSSGGGATGGSAGATGGSAGATGGSAGATGGSAGATGGSAGATGGSAGATGGSAGATGGSAGATGGSAGATGGSAGATGGSAGATGGSAGATGGSAGAGPTCTGSMACVPIPPKEWKFVHYIEQVTPPPATLCTSDFAPSKDYFSDASSSNDTCTCKCGNPAGGNCGSVKVELFGDGSCGGAKVTVENSCHDENKWKPDSFRVTYGKLTPGKCEPAATPNKASTKYDDPGHACEYTGTTTATCANSKDMCVPSAASANQCVMHAGDVKCPAGYDKKYVRYSGVNDTRSCAGVCGCKTPTQRKCTVHVRAYTEDGCTTTVWPKLIDKYASWTQGDNHQCKDASRSPDFKVKSAKYGLSGPSGGSCAPKDASPDMTGNVTRDDATKTTICCIN